LCGIAVPSAEEGINILGQEKIDLVVLDINLPGMNGYDMCRLIREKYDDIAVIMLTAKSQDMDKIIGLEFGADDYMIKPFNPQELVARIRTILRRTRSGKVKSNDIVQCGKLKIDNYSREVFKEDVEIKVTAKEFNLIYLLSTNPGKAYTRDELLNQVWGEDFFGDVKTLDVHIRRIREKIEDDPSNPVFIETVWGVGYRWRKEV